MNLKILFMIIVYYSIFSVIIVLGGAIFTDEAGYEQPLRLNQTGNLTSSEVASAGLFDTGVDFGRFFMLITLGIGLPSTFPTWFMLIFSFWQTIVTLLSVGFVISSIWNG